MSRATSSQRDLSVSKVVIYAEKYSHGALAAGSMGSL